MRRVFFVVLMIGVCFFVPFVVGEFGQVGSLPSASFVVRQDVAPSFQTYYGARQDFGGLSTYWPTLGQDPNECKARQDILLGVAPAGCQPAVVRSDLLAEQNVPVFCQLDALQINPLLSIKDISSLTFTGKYPNEVAGVGFHPARAALRTRDTLLGDPLVNNVGYAVVVLKKQPDERKVSGNVTVQLTARIRYDAEKSFGIGRADFLLPVYSDAEWEQARKEGVSSFYHGRYSLRLEEVSDSQARVSVYDGDRKLSSTTAKRGALSPELYLPGGYCQSAVQVEYLGYGSAEPRAVVEVIGARGTDRLDVYKGSSFLNGQCRIESLFIDNQTSATGRIGLSCAGQRFILRLDPLNQTAILDDQENLSGNMSVAIQTYEQVAREYGAELSTEGGVPYGEQALQQALQLAQTQNLRATEYRLLNQLITQYPDSLNKAQYQRERDFIAKVNTINASALVYVQGEYRTIRLTALIAPRVQPHITFSLGGFESGNLNLGETRLVEQKRVEKTVQGRTVSVIEQLNVTLVRLTANEAFLTTGCPGSVQGKDFTLNGREVTRALGTFSLKEGESATLCGKGFTLRDIEVERIAQLRVIPKANNVETLTNVTISLGIEKRAIQLSPEKAKQRMAELNASIKRWDQLNTQLGKAVTGLKAACFATSGVLIMKNFYTRLSGSGYARQQVMRGEGGWTNFCHAEIAAGRQKSLDACYSKYSDQIEAQVKKEDAAVKQTNEKLKSIEAKYTRDNGLLSKSVDTEKAASELREQMVKDPTISKRTVVLDKGTAQERTVPLGKLLENKEGYQQGEYGYDQLRELYRNSLLDGQSIGPPGSDPIGTRLSTTGQQIVSNQALNVEVKKSRDAQQRGDIEAMVVSPGAQFARQGSVISADAVSRNDQLLSIYTDPRSESESSKLPHAYYSKTVVTKTESRLKNTFDGTYTLGLSKQPNGVYKVDDVYEVRNGVATKLAEDKETDFITTYNLGSIKAQDTSNLDTNKWADPQVQYYETEPHKGLPALVPVDPARGWYAATRQTLPVFGGMAGFEASGRPVSFYLCNVGINGRAQFFEGGGDDSCTQINLNTAQATNRIAGISESRAGQLVTLAQRALEDAARAHAQGVRSVSIRGQGYKVGKPAANLPGVQCQDFMSPAECTLLFNVCDPVICPATRCDFGGKYAVPDVIQSGIIGSTLLCLPNFPEVKVPVCLSGIHAGVDAYTSILKAHRDCLDESVKTGKMTGICDQIYSIYSCEFFWKQLAPLANLALPKLLESVQGQGVKGGGEYLTVQGAWQNTKQSLDYFTNVYGVNSFQAFRARSIEEVGTPICKNFISAKFPASFKTLIQPDSPVQFHAYFSSTKFTDATVPATAQYKVFYHIYAGKDQGASYKVYLKNPPQTSYYVSQPFVQVASGFIGKGQNADETKDFTAPEGYQELCVSINGAERCGFKQVSTSFAVNYVRDSLIADQITDKTISSEKECVSGKTSALALLNPNIQQGADEALNPDLYRRGVIRICATENPGKTTDPTRFVDVGQCDDQKLRCWLDSRSVQNAITDVNKGVKNETLATLKSYSVDSLARDTGILNQQAGQSELNRLSGGVETLFGKKGSLASADVTKAGLLARELRQTREILFFNHQKARALFLEGKVYGRLAEDELTRTQVSKSDFSLRCDWEKGWQWKSSHKDTGNGQWQDVTVKDVPDSLSSEYQDVIESLRDVMNSDPIPDELYQDGMNALERVIYYPVQYVDTSASTCAGVEQGAGKVGGLQKDTTSAPVVTPKQPTFDKRVGQTFTLPAQNEEDTSDVHWRYSYGLRSWQWSFDKQNWNGLTIVQASFGGDAKRLFAEADDIRKALDKDNDEETGNILLLNAGAKVTAPPSLLPTDPVAEREAKKATLTEEQAKARNEDTSLSFTDYLGEGVHPYLKAFCLLRTEFGPGIVGGVVGSQASLQKLDQLAQGSSEAQALAQELRVATPLASVGGSTSGVAVTLLQPKGFAGALAPLVEGNMLLHEGRLFIVQGKEIVLEVLTITHGVPGVARVTADTLPRTLTGYTLSKETIARLADITFKEPPKLFNAAGKEIIITDTFVVSTAQGLKSLPASSQNAKVFSSFSAKASSGIKWAFKILNHYAVLCAPINLMVMVEELAKMDLAQEEAKIAATQADNLNWIIKSSRERIEAITLASKDMATVYRHYGFAEDPAVAQMLTDLEAFTEGARRDTLALAARYTAFGFNEDTTDYSKISDAERNLLISDWKKINEQLRDLKEALEGYVGTLSDTLATADTFPTFTVPSYVSINQKPDFVLNKRLVYGEDLGRIPGDSALSMFSSSLGGANTVKTLFVLTPRIDERNDQTPGSDAKLFSVSTYTLRIKGTYIEPRWYWADKKVVIDEQVGTVTRDESGTSIIRVDAQKARPLATKLLKTADEVRAFAQQLRLLEYAEVRGTEVYSTQKQPASTARSQSTGEGPGN